MAEYQPDPIIRPLPQPDPDDDLDIHALVADGIRAMPVDEVRRQAPFMYQWYLHALDVVGGLGEEDPDVMPDWMAAAIDEVLAREEEQT